MPCTMAYFCTGVGFLKPHWFMFSAKDFGIFSLRDSIGSVSLL